MYSAFASGAIGVQAGFEEAVELAAHYGFEGVYLDLDYLLKVGAETVVYMLEERNLRAAGWNLPVRLMGDQAQYDQGLEKLPAIAEACSGARALRCGTWVPPASNDMPRAEMFRFLVDRLAPVCQVLGDCDVSLGLEFIGPATARAGKKHEFIYTMDGMLELCRAVGTGNVGLTVDCWHLYTGGGEMDDVLRLTDEEVVGVHVNDAPAGVALDAHKDNVRRLPGETGVIDAARFLRNLQQIGYSGPVMVEPFDERLKALDAPAAIRKTKDALDAVWPE
jgi:sugar phosphate isomerase/epimerase